MVGEKWGSSIETLQTYMDGTFDKLFEMLKKVPVIGKAIEAVGGKEAAVGAMFTTYYGGECNVGRHVIHHAQSWKNEQVVRGNFPPTQGSKCDEKTGIQLSNGASGANPEDTQLGVAFQIMMEMLPFHAVAILCFPDVLEPERLDLTIENYLHETFVENNRDTTIESDKAEKARLEHLEELRNLCRTRAPGSAGLGMSTNELNGDDGFGGEYQFRFASRKSGEHRTKAGTSAELKQSAKQSIGWSSMPSLPSMETFFSDGDNLEKAQQITEEDIQLLDADGNEIGPVMKVDTTSGVGAEMVDLQVKAMAEDQQKADCSGLDDNLTAAEQYDKMKSHEIQITITVVARILRKRGG